MTTIRFQNPKTIAPPPGYTQVVHASGSVRTIYVAGQLGLDLENRLVGAPGDFAAQAEQAFVNLELALKAAGATIKDVVKINNYLTDMAHIGLFRMVRDRHVNTAAPPASTTVAISQLARPDALFEIEAIAVIAMPAEAPARARAGKAASKASKASKKKTAKKRR